MLVERSRLSHSWCGWPGALKHRRSRPRHDLRHRWSVSSTPNAVAAVLPCAGLFDVGTRQDAMTLASRWDHPPRCRPLLRLRNDPQVRLGRLPAVGKLLSRVLVRDRREDDHILALLPVHWRCHLVAGRQLARIHETQHLGRSRRGRGAAAVQWTILSRHNGGVGSGRGSRAATLRATGTRRSWRPSWPGGLYAPSPASTGCPTSPCGTSSPATRRYCGAGVAAGLFVTVRRRATRQNQVCPSEPSETGMSAFWSAPG